MQILIFYTRFCDQGHKNRYWLLFTINFRQIYFIRAYHLISAGTGFFRILIAAKGFYFLTYHKIVPYLF
jgi:hypothetical protein